MAIQPIPFGASEDTSSEELGGASPRCINVIVDGQGVINKRPGIVASAELPGDVVDAAGIGGIFATNDGQLFVASKQVNSTLYRVAGGVAASLGQFVAATRPVFTETEKYLLVAGSGAIRKVDLTTGTMSDLGGGPPIASHIAANSSRLLANDTQLDKTKVRFSGVFQGTVDTSQMEDWTDDGIADHGGFFTAEARPDDVVALAENTNEVFVWGVDNVQVFVPDATAVFAPAATREFGCLAPNSIIKEDQNFYWFDQYRRFVVSDGRQFQTLEKPIKKQLDALLAPTDCFGFRALVGFADCFVWVFPTDQIAFCYQQGGGWSEWQGYDATAGNFWPLIISAAYLRRDGGSNVIGTTSGRMGKLSLDEPTDLGGLILSQVVTGFVDRGTDNRKICKSVKITARRGTTSAPAFGRLEWRDDTGGWNGPLFIDFGQSPDYAIVKEFRSLGVYNRRQWRFTFAESARLSLVRVMEEFEPLGI